MSRLEVTAARVLPALILGQPGSIAPEDQPIIAAWLLKTALVSMLVSSREDRENGYGLPMTEYRGLFETREQGMPLPATRCWLGRYQGSQHVSTCVTPMIVKIDGSTEPGQPQAYLITLVLGSLILIGIRFTAPLLDLELTPGAGFVPFWPRGDIAVTPPLELAADDKSILKIEKGIGIRTKLSGISLVHWRTAAELPQSTLTGSIVRMLAPCGNHYVSYPAMLGQDAFQGSFYAFMTSCECDKSYLVKTEPDGAHFKAEGSSEAVTHLYEQIVGEEILIEDEGGAFWAKHLS
jgi:hypothetical protein